MSALPPALLQDMEAAGLRPVDRALADWGYRHRGGRPGALGLALASHAVGLGHTCLPLDDVSSLGTAAQLVDGPRLAGELAGNPLVATPASEAPRPLVLDGERLYLQRYWDYEQRLARRLRELLAAPREPVDTQALGPAGGLFAYDWTGPNETNWQAVAAFVAQRHRLAVISGGPGTGKTYTVVRIMLRLVEAALASQRPPPVIRLAAPTGKAAARMITSIQDGLAALEPDPALRDHLPQEASTLHRLLRLRQGSTEPGHHRGDPIPADTVIVDEASMVDLPLMAKLADAVPDGGRLILLGDRYQLASVESGAVLADLCAPAGVNAFSGEQRQAAGDLLAAAPSAGTPVSPLADHVVTLQTSHRFRADSPIGRLAAAINAGEADAVEAALSQGGDEVQPRFDSREPALQDLVQELAEAYAGLHEAADPGEAVEHLASVRLLTAMRVGPSGSEALNRRIAAELGLSYGFDPDARWYHGRPLMVTENDPRAGLYNGDVGVLWGDGQGAVRAWFRTEAGLRSFHPSALPRHDTVYAMTIHKSQGSEFDTTYLLLPDTESRMLTRELLYTGVTRARSRLRCLGPRQAWRTAVTRRTRRVSGLPERLSPGSGLEF